MVPAISLPSLYDNAGKPWSTQDIHNYNYHYYCSTGRSAHYLSMYLYFFTIFSFNSDLFIIPLKDFQFNEIASAGLVSFEIYTVCSADVTQSVDVLSILILHYNTLLHSLHSSKSSLTWVFSRTFWVPCAPWRSRWNWLRPPSHDNGAHGTEKFLLKTEVSGDFAQWSECNLHE